MEQYKQMIQGMANKSDPSFDPKKTALLVVDLVNDGSNDEGFFRKKLGFDTSLMKQIEPNVLELVSACKAKGIPVIGVQAVYDFDYIPAPMRERFEAMGIKGGLAPKGAWGSEIIPEIKNAGLDLILVKSHYSAFSPGRTFGYKPGNREVEDYMSLPSSKDGKVKASGNRVMQDYFTEACKKLENVGTHLDNGGVISLDNYLEGRGIDTIIVTGASTHVCVDSAVSGASERGYKILMPIDGVAAEGIPGEGFTRHYIYLSNHGLFKAELTETSKLLKKLNERRNER